MKSMTSARREALWRWARRGACVLGLTLLMADGGLRQDEIECEEAFSYLQSCCPQGALPTHCVHQTGCDGTVTVPGISIEESQCILSQSCEALAASFFCKQTFSPGAPPIVEVCP